MNDFILGYKVYDEADRIIALDDFSFSFDESNLGLNLVAASPLAIVGLLMF